MDVEITKDKIFKVYDGMRLSFFNAKEVTSKEAIKIFFNKDGTLKNLDELSRTEHLDIFLDPDIQRPLKHRARDGFYVIHVTPWPANDPMKKKYMKGLTTDYLLSYNENKLYTLTFDKEVLA